MAKTGGIAADQLRAYIEKIERLEDEKAQLTADIREVYGEAKGNGFDTKTMRQIVRLRKLDKDAMQEQEYLREPHMPALGLNRSAPRPLKAPAGGGCASRRPAHRPRRS